MDLIGFARSAPIITQLFGNRAMESWSAGFGLILLRFDELYFAQRPPAMPPPRHGFQGLGGGGFGAPGEPPQGRARIEVLSDGAFRAAKCYQERGA